MTKEQTTTSDVARQETARARREKRRAEIETRRAMMPMLDGASCRLIECDVSGLSEHVAAGTVDRIITEPPCGSESVGLYAELSRFAAHALKLGGMCVAIGRQGSQLEALAQLGECLRYHWLGCYLMPGGDTFKPLLLFTKGKYGGGWFGDVTRPDPNDKGLHGIEDLVERFTRVGDVVCDPFGGTGEIGAAALALGCPFIGADVDLETASMKIHGPRHKERHDG